MIKKIALIKGDGIGPEIVTQAMKVLEKISRNCSTKFEFTEVLMGGCAIDELGTPLPQETIDICLASDSVLLGAVGGIEWDNNPPELRPEKGLLGIRNALKLFANIRPAKLFPVLADACPLKNEIIKDGLDIVIIRELIGGAYFGKHITSTDENGVTTAVDYMQYSDFQIQRIARKAFEMAGKRKGFVHSVDKANVLDSSRLWRKIVHETVAEFPNIRCEDILVDNCAMQLVRNPRQFDILLTENLFGDILSDEASMLTGSLGMLPSASLGEGSLGLYEPIHGSAPDIAGMDKANPIATILSVAMMLKYSFNMDDEADLIENAVNKALENGYRTCDIMSDGSKLVGCNEMGDIICKYLF